MLKRRKARSIDVDFFLACFNASSAAIQWTAISGRHLIEPNDNIGQHVKLTSRFRLGAINSAHNWFPEFIYSYIRQQHLGKRFWYFTLRWELQQHICDHLTNPRVIVAEEGDDLWNGRCNRLMKCSYSYVNKTVVRKINILRCRESVHSASAPATRTSALFSPKRAIIFSITSWINSWNLPTGIWVTNMRGQEIKYPTMGWENHQHTYAPFTNIRISITEEGKDWRNSKPPKLGYKYVGDI